MSHFSFKNIEHALATVARDTVVGARAVAAVSGKIAEAEPAIEQVTALIDPPAVVFERAAFAALAALAKAANDTAAASSHNGLNVQLDAQAIEDYKQLYKMLVGRLQGYSDATAGEPANQVAAH